MSSRTLRILQLLPPPECSDSLAVCSNECIYSPMSNPMSSIEKVQAWVDHARSKSCPGFKTSTAVHNVIDKRVRVRRVLFTKENLQLHPIPENPDKENEITSLLIQENTTTHDENNQQLPFTNKTDGTAASVSGKKLSKNCKVGSKLSEDVSSKPSKAPPSQKKPNTSESNKSPKSSAKKTKKLEMKKTDVMKGKLKDTVALPTKENPVSQDINLLPKPIETICKHPESSDEDVPLQQIQVNLIQEQERINVVSKKNVPSKTKVEPCKQSEGVGFVEMHTKKTLGIGKEKPIKSSLNKNSCASSTDRKTSFLSLKKSSVQKSPKSSTKNTKNLGKKETGVIKGNLKITKALSIQKNLVDQDVNLLQKQTDTTFEHPESSDEDVPLQQIQINIVQKHEKAASKKVVASKTIVKPSKQSEGVGLIKNNTKKTLGIGKGKPKKDAPFNKENTNVSTQSIHKSDKSVTQNTVIPIPLEKKPEEGHVSIVKKVHNQKSITSVSKETSKCTKPTEPITDSNHSEGVTLEVQEKPVGHDSFVFPSLKQIMPMTSGPKSFKFLNNIRFNDRIETHEAKRKTVRTESSLDLLDLSSKVQEASRDLSSTGLDLSTKDKLPDSDPFLEWCDMVDNVANNDDFSDDQSSDVILTTPAQKSLPVSFKKISKHKHTLNTTETPSVVSKKPTIRKLFLSAKEKETSVTKNLDTPSCASDISIGSSRYSFRVRAPTKTVREYSSGSEDCLSSDDEVEWSTSDPRIENTSTSRIRVQEENDSDKSDEEQMFVTIPKTNSKAWMKKLAPTRPENTNEDGWEVSDLKFREQESVTFSSPADELAPPIEYFEYFFDEDLMNHIVRCTNIASTVNSDGKKCINVTAAEMRKFFGILLFMGIVQLPSLRDYWLKDTNVSQVASIMTYNRFAAIRAQLHLYDKSKEHLLDPNDRYSKVRFLLSHMQTKCLSIEQESSYSIDETMVPYKGKFAGSLRQFIKTKPHRFGIKMFNLAGSSGMIYDFLPYAGSSTFYNLNFNETEASMGIGAQIVIHLCRIIDKPEMKAVYFDNYFSSCKLVRYLLTEYNLRSIGTIRSNRIDKCPLKSDKDLAREGRGSHDSRVKGGVQVIKWLDNKVVHVVTTLAGVHPIGTVQRYNKNTKARGTFPVPCAVQLYNKKMGGVDLHDMLVELYRTPTRARRWYMTLISYMLDVATVNSWLLYRRHASTLHVKELDLKQFRSAISRSMRGECSKLATSKQKKPNCKPRGYVPDDSVRYDGFQHWPSFKNGQSRCKYCSSGFTTVVCARCNVSLCFVPTRQCFSNFHMPEAA